MNDLRPIQFVVLPCLQPDGMLAWRKKLFIRIRVWLVVSLYRSLSDLDRAYADIWMAHYAVVDRE